MIKYEKVKFKKDKRNVFQSEISEIVCGKRKPSVYLAKRLVKVFRSSFGDLS